MSHLKGSEGACYPNIECAAAVVTEICVRLLAGLQKLLYLIRAVVQCMFG